MTDNQGRKVDFKNTVIIMTSNIGAQKITGKGRKTLGFGGDGGDAQDFERIREEVTGELKNVFRPEFLNRIDDIIVFNRLSEVEIEEIAEGMLKNVAARMSEMDAELHWTDSAKKHLAKVGFDPVYGARPLRRAIQSQVEDLVAETFLRGGIPKGGQVTLDEKDGKLFIVEAAEKTADSETEKSEDNA